MDLFEYQGKQFFASFDIPVSPGEAVTTVDDAVAAAERLGDYPFVVKAKVQVGGRSKAGRSQAFIAEWVNANSKAREIVQAYLACVSFVDAQVGRVLDALEQGPHRDNTIIVLFSDHGFHLGEKEHFGKTTLWERSARVQIGRAHV